MGLGPTLQPLMYDKPRTSQRITITAATGHIRPLDVTSSAGGGARDSAIRNDRQQWGAPGASRNGAGYDDGFPRVRRNKAQGAIVIGAAILAAVTALFLVLCVADAHFATKIAVPVLVVSVGILAGHEWLHRHG
jgi:hypothetical protein